MACGDGFSKAADLEGWFGEAELAALQNRRALDLAHQTHRCFWDEGRGIYADDLSHEHWSEHAQCLAILSGLISEQRAERVKAGLLENSDLSRTTIYFSHYLFEAYQKIGAIPALLKRLDQWKVLLENGLTTPIEQPHPTRSDCLAWGSHPLIHFYTALAGIRPKALGFSEVEICPQLGSLRWLQACLPHPKGRIDLEVKSGWIAFSLPEGVQAFNTGVSPTCVTSALTAERRYGEISNLLPGQ